MKKQNVYDYLKQGFNVIPLKKGTKEPLIRWQDFQSRKITQEEIEKYFNDDVNIGIITGKVSGLVVVDFDKPEALQKFIDDYGFEPQNFPCVRTRRGFHFYFKYTDKIRTKKLEGVDIKSNGGYVVAPDSVVEGHLYKWEVKPNGELPELPECFFYEDTEIEKDFQKNDYTELLKGVEKGRRNNTLTILAGHFFNKGLDYKEVEEIIMNWNLKNKPPLEEAEVKKSLWSIYKRDRGQGIKIQTALEGIINNIIINLPDVSVIIKYNTDKKNVVFDEGDFANWFIEKYKNKLVWCERWGYWLEYQGGVFKRVENPDVLGKAKNFLEEIQNFIFRQKDQSIELRARLVLKLSGCNNKAFLSGAVYISRQKEGGLGKYPEDFDTEPHLLNLKNGVYDLNKNLLLPHSQDYLQTKQIKVEYKQAECPRWKEFLKEIFKGDDDLIDYVKRALGYSLYGEASENKFFVCYGRGKNGKSTFINTIQEIFGDYAKGIQADTLIEKDGSHVRNDLAGLKGTRFVAVSELPERKKLDTNLIKQLTGRDIIEARFLFQEFFNFRMSGKIWIITNNKPVIWEVNEAMRRRLKFIPFTYTIPEDRVILNYDKVLLEEKEGILNWLIEGWQEYQKRGLRETEEPEVIKLFTKEYFEEIDFIKCFINDRCILEEKAKTPHKELYEAYKKWAELNEGFELTSKKLSKHLENRAEDFGLIKIKIMGQLYWKGIRILTEEELKEKEARENGELPF